MTIPIAKNQSTLGPWVGRIRHRLLLSGRRLQMLDGLSRGTEARAWTFPGVYVVRPIVANLQEPTIRGFRGWSRGALGRVFPIPDCRLSIGDWTGLYITLDTRRRGGFRGYILAAWGVRPLGPNSTPPRGRLPTGLSAGLPGPLPCPLSGGLHPPQFPEEPAAQPAPSLDRLLSEPRSPLLRPLPSELLSPSRSPSLSALLCPLLHRSLCTLRSESLSLLLSRLPDGLSAELLSELLTEKRQLRCRSPEA